MKNEWLDRFKIALIEKDFAKLEKLHQSMPSFETLEEMVTAKALIGETLILLQKERNRVKNSMDQMKRTIAFQKNALQEKTKFDRSY